MLLTQFEYTLGNKKLKVLAKARSVNLYEAKGLQLFIMDNNNKQVKVDSETLQYIEEEATMHLFEESEDEELNFED